MYTERYGDLKRFVELHFADSQLQKSILALQEFGVPPAQSFICLTYMSGKEYFDAYLKAQTKSPKMQFGKMIECEMNKLNYIKIDKKPIELYLHSASMFKKKL